ncbi:MAG: beta-ketoacyl synthase N-terminal-like domain-containing protein, partial [Alphaproteobacteria bacterium]
MKRVVVTGLGMVTPLACGVKESWQSLLAGNSGLGAITKFDVSDMPARVAGEVPVGDEANAFHVDDYIEPRLQRRMDLFIHFALAAADQAVRDAEWQPTEEEALERTGVLIGSGIGGLPAIEAAA